MSTIVHSADGTPISYLSMGSGPGLLLVGGANRTAEHYLPLATALAGDFTVHVVDRRGRGASGPQGPGYSLAKEVEDLIAVQKQTGARLAVGHSFGGLVVMETARAFQVFDRVAVYEPGVIAQPEPTAWMAPYRERLAAGDPYGAFIHFIRGSGGAPPFMTKMPDWYLRLVLRVVFRGPTWRSLLEPNLAEHEQVAAQYGRLPEYAAVRVPVLILVGSRSPAATRANCAALRDTLPEVVLETLEGLNHFGPEGRTAAVVAGRALAFLR
ncbi:alpha/beta fold hydrolase [Microbispora sp. NPDC049125]|uniref:alpha/beta fold hydrolase n=1 Tax=Microbispora sp. NPDC049125 TaxID=3154929 RepID=UPI0034666811